MNFQISLASGETSPIILLYQESIQLLDYTLTQHMTEPLVTFTGDIFFEDRSGPDNLVRTGLGDVN